MNFAQHVDNNRQNLVNDLNTIKYNLTQIFDLSDVSLSTEAFHLKINGISYIRGNINKDNTISISFNGVDKYRSGYDKEESLENLKQKVVANLSIFSRVNDFSVDSKYCTGYVRIFFDRLTDSVVRDIMFLIQATNAKLRPSVIGRF